MEFFTDGIFQVTIVSVLLVKVYGCSLSFSLRYTGLPCFRMLHVISSVLLSI